MRRLSIVLLPFLAAFALVFGMGYLYTAYGLLQRGEVVSAALVFLFGAMGVGLAVAIWVARKRVRRSGGAPNASSGGPAA